MDVTLSVQANTLSPDALQDLTRDLCKTLNREADVQASLIEAPAAPGAKGGWESLGQILLHVPWKEIATHGAGVVVGEAVISVLKPYFDRLSSLIITARGPDGKEHTFTAESFKPDHDQQTKK